MAAPKVDELSRWRTAHADVLRLGRTLRMAAEVFRRYAGELRYRPQFGVEGRIGDDLLQAAATIRETLAAINALASRWDEEITWMRGLDPGMPVDDIQRGHATAREAARLLRSALEIFDRSMQHPETAPLDAPYGTGAPTRVHPGAQCTWVADRAEWVARELANVTLRKENVLLGVRRTSS